MAKTAAEKQRGYRQRRARLVAELQAENEQLRTGLAEALIEIDRLSARECQHPAGVDDLGCCRVCHEDLT